MSKQRWFFYSLLLFVFFGACVISLSIMLKYDEFGCVRTDIDINSGDIRYRYYIAFVLVREKVTKTKFSILGLNPKHIQPGIVGRKHEISRQTWAPLNAIPSELQFDPV